MLGIIGLTAILGCSLGAILGIVSSVITVGVTVGVSVAQQQQAEELQNEMLEAQEDAEGKAEKKLDAQQEAAYRQQERTNLANIMAMGSAIMTEQFKNRKAKYETVAELKKLGDSKKTNSSSEHYSHGTPVEPSGNASQSQLNLQS
ncbi:MAG: hypothetical protein WC683_05295 [bacterium]